MKLKNSLIVPLLLLVIKIIIAPEPVYTQNQYFNDETQERLPIVIDVTFDADFGDVDNDGDLDLLFSNTSSSTYSNRLYINDGFGIYTDETDLRLPTVKNVASAFVDVERDGDLDIYGCESFSEDYLYINDGLGVFSDESKRIPLEEDSRSMDAAFGDVDSNLDLEIVIAEFNFRFNRLLLNNSSGFFSYAPPWRFPTGQDNSNGVAFGDVDGDYDLDVIFSNEWISGARNVLVINNGNGYFTDETFDRMPDNYQVSTSVILGDVDIDGDLDIFVPNAFLSSMNKLLINNGSGYFSDESALRLPMIEDISTDAAFGDVDNDNDLDIVIANDYTQGQGYSNRLYINDGNGFFADETDTRYPAGGDNAFDILFGDVDRDGDLDIIVANLGEYPDGEQNRLLINISTPDSFPPIIPRTYHHPDTGDTTNSYLITTTVWDNISVVIGELKVSLFYRSMRDINDADFTEIPMLDCGGFLYRENIPAQQSGTTVEYYIKAEDRMGNVSYDPTNTPDSVYNFLVDVNVGIENDPPPLALVPKTFALSQDYPNPFNPSTTIRYDIPVGRNSVQVEINIYDVRGRLVRKLVDQEKEAGRYKVHWDGRGEHGQQVSSGVYLYQIDAGEFISTRKMVLIR
jgi:hypothetical protein